MSRVVKETKGWYGTRPIEDISAIMNLTMSKTRNGDYHSGLL